MIQNQDTFLARAPASNLPAPRLMASILAIITLAFSGRFKTLLLKVGSQVIIPCSIITNKNAPIKKTITSNFVMSANICLKSSPRFAPGISLPSSKGENNRNKKDNKQSPLSNQ